ncbi:VOC family protein [Sandaracinobacteroides saxicola]|uniref:VOC family protein n=1 Tax=Sandaracinobacteroides saxicola TaxID=2759707 RepID=A0A7G5IFE0_9SPHN|nr:VOC family protein [Sandaracinobacteroides saxicola]QMW22082.1 VOC family protein [Sandaracinobacteroides saxicola]
MDNKLQSADTPPASNVSALVRAALFVSDIEASTTFYRDILGLTVSYWDGPLDHPAVPALIGVGATDSTRARILQVPGPSFGMIGLFEVTPRPARVRKRAEGVNVGEAVLVFYCADLDPLVARLTAAGHRILCPPTFLQVSPTRGQREMTCADPDGILVNVIERDDRLSASRDDRLPVSRDNRLA